MKKLNFVFLGVILSFLFFSPVMAAPDTESPTIVADELEDWEDGDTDLTFVIADTGGSGILQSKYCISDTVCDPDKGSVINENTVIVSGDGIHVVYFISEDKAHNFSEVGSTTVKIDETEPVISVGGVSSGWYNLEQTANVVCDDATSGCEPTSYMYYLSPIGEGVCEHNTTKYTLGTTTQVNADALVCTYGEDVVGLGAFSDNSVIVQFDYNAPDAEDVNVQGDWENVDFAMDIVCNDNGESGCVETLLNVVDYGDECVAENATSTHLITAHSTACWQATDLAGNIYLASTTIFVDKISPSINLISPATTTWQNTTFDLDMSDFDLGGSEIDFCEYKLESGTTSNLTLVQDWTNRVCSTSFEVTVGDGMSCDTEGSDTCKITLRNRDVAQNITTLEVLYSISLTNPVISYMSLGITTNGWYATDTVVQLDAVSSVSELSKIFYRVGDSGEYSEENCSGFTCQKNILVSDGEYEVYYYVNDLAGNESNRDFNDIKVDGIDPAVDAGNDQEKTSAFIQVATSSDNLSGIDSFLWTKVSGPGVITFDDETTLSPEILADTEGDYVLRLNVTDLAGNSEYDEMSLKWVVNTSPSSGGSGGYFYLPKTHEAPVEEVSTSTVASTTVDEVGGDADEVVEKFYKKEKEKIRVIDLYLGEIEVIMSGNSNLFSMHTGIKINKNLEALNYVVTHKLLEGLDVIEKVNKYSINNFITYGTDSTKHLGVRERASVLESYKLAYQKLPSTENNWLDVLKIANGRWPSELNSLAENNAEKIFEKIYLRKNGLQDRSAIVLMTYGLRPITRNLESEKRAIIIYENIFGSKPSSIMNWNIMRAIAYSGSAR